MSKIASPKFVPGAVIVGAGPSGLPAAGCLKQKGIPSLILERAKCLASMWKLKTYDRLRLHLPNQICQLPFWPLPKNFPSYPTKQQLLAYLKAYADHFDTKPVFNQTVVSVEFDHVCHLWRVKSQGVLKIEDVAEYVCLWVLVAIGECAEEVLHQFEGMGELEGQIVHTCKYKSEIKFCGKNVLVVGCGNSGMEVCFDLCNHSSGNHNFGMEDN